MLIFIAFLSEYLLNLAVYARNEASPSPQLNDVSTMPKIATHFASAYATRRKPAACNAMARNIRTLGNGL